MAPNGLCWTTQVSASLLLLLLLSNGVQCGANSDHGHHDKWSYDKSTGDGPSHWPSKFEGCRGQYQSPVDLSQAIEDEDHALSDLDLRGYDRPLKVTTLKNNGHSVQMQVDSAATLSGGCLGGDRYDFSQVHFHWGSTDDKGSEHTIHNKPFALEGHLVHTNRKYKAEDAPRYPDGLAVLGVFYQVVGHNVSQLAQLVDAVEEVSRVKIEDKVRGRLVDTTLRSLLPDDTSRFYCYRNGSLTTPSCNEAVTWTVMAQPAHIGRRQLATFRRLKFEDGSFMVDNYRPVQKLNRRTIYLHTSSSPGSASRQSLLLLFLLPFFSLLFQVKTTGPLASVLQ